MNLFLKGDLSCNNLWNVLIHRRVENLVFEISAHPDLVGSRADLIHRQLPIIADNHGCVRSGIRNIPVLFESELYFIPAANPVHVNVAL